MMTLYKQFENYFNTRCFVMKVLVGVAFMTAIYCAPAMVVRGIQNGSKLGEVVFNVTHPNPLGQMSFDASDFEK